MIPSDSQNLESYLPVYDAIPEKWEEARPFMVENMKKISNAVNIREIGWYLDQEILTGKSFIPGLNNVASRGTNQQYRSIFRKVINFGTLPNAATKSVAHNIVFDANFSLINLYLSATDPVNFLCFSVSYWSNAAPPSIILNMDQTNINVVTTSNYNVYTRSFVVVEYIQEP